MIGCTRCGRWHLDVEEVAGQRMTCTEIKRYWSQIRQDHLQLEGHPAQISTDESGNWICMKCNNRLL